MIKRLLVLVALIAPWFSAFGQFSPTALPRSRPARQAPAPPPPEFRVASPSEPITVVLALAGAVEGYRLGRGHEHTHLWPFFGDLKGPFWHMAGGAAVGGLVGHSIQAPVNRWNNSYSLRSGSCLDSAVFIRMRGRDTVSVEAVYHEWNALRGVSVGRDGVTRYRASMQLPEVDAGLSLSHWRSTSVVDRPADAGVMYFQHGDSARILPRGSRHWQMLRAPDNLAAVAPGNVGVDELLTRRVVQFHEMDIPTIDPAGDGMIHVAHFIFTGPRVLHAQFGGTDLEAELNVDDRGRILSGTYMSDTDVVTVRRAPCGTFR